MTLGLNLESSSNQLSKFCWYHSSKNRPNRLLIESQQTPRDRLLSVWFSSPNLVTIRLLTDFWRTPDELLTDYWHTPEWLPTDFQQTHINPAREFWDDTRSQFGELFKSALQIWRAFYYSSPNFVTITLPKIVLTDWHQTPKRSMRFIGWWHLVHWGSIEGPSGVHRELIGIHRGIVRLR